MEIGFIFLFIILAGFVMLGEGIALIRRDIDDLKELMNKK